MRGLVVIQVPLFGYQKGDKLKLRQITKLERNRCRASHWGCV